MKQHLEAKRYCFTCSDCYDPGCVTILGQTFERTARDLKDTFGIDVSDGEITHHRWEQSSEKICNGRPPDGGLKDKIKSKGRAKTRD